MKRILLIFALTISLVACSQTQTFIGVKTFASPPKFQNLIQNDLNTKILSVNSTGVLQWKSASSFTSPTPSLEQVLAVSGNVLDGNSKITFNPSVDYNTEYSFGAARFNYSGTGDYTYGSNGTVMVGISGKETRLDSGSLNLKTNGFNAISIDDTANGNGVMNVGSGNIFINDSAGYSLLSLDLRNPAGNTSLKLLDGTNHQSFVELDAYRQIAKVSDGISWNSNLTNYTGITPDGFLFHSSNGVSAKIKLSEPLVESYPSLNEWFITPVYGKIPSLNTTAPASATATGRVGEIRVTPAYIYVCTAVDTWVRSAVATW